MPSGTARSGERPCRGPDGCCRRSGVTEGDPVGVMCQCDASNPARYVGAWMVRSVRLPDARGAVVNTAWFDSPYRERLLGAAVREVWASLPTTWTFQWSRRPSVSGEVRRSRRDDKESGTRPVGSRCAHVGSSAVVVCIEARKAKFRGACCRSARGEWRWCPRRVVRRMQ